MLEGEAGIGKSTLWLAGVGRGARARAARALVASGGGRARARVRRARRPVRGRPRRRAPCCRRRGGGRSRSRSCARRPQTSPSTTARSAWRCATCCTCSASEAGLRRDRRRPVARRIVGERTGVRAAPSRASPVLLLLARRLRRHRAVGARAGAGRGRVERLPVGPLSVGALHRLLHDRLGRTFARQTLLRIHERSGGNPFFALELARVLDEDVDPLEPLAGPGDAGGARPHESRRAARDDPRRAGASGGARDAVGVAPGAGGRRADALGPAVAAHVVERESGRDSFHSPVAVVGALQRSRCRAPGVHARIAEIVETRFCVPRHLALSRDAPDAAVAAALDDAATIAAERGASADAAELAEQAMRLTPANERGERHRRALAAARAHRAAGEWTRARTIASELLAAEEVGPLRAEALVLLAELEGLDRATALLEEALHEATVAAGAAGGHPVQARLGGALQGGVRPRARARASGARARRRGRRRRAAGRCARMLAFLGGAVGDPQAAAHAARAHELRSHRRRAAAEEDAARSRRVRARQTTRRPGRSSSGSTASSRERDELAAAEALNSLSWVELWGGRWELAAECAERAYEITPVRARSAMGPRADRGDRCSSRSARARPRALGAGAAARARSSSGCTRQSISGRWASSLCRSGDLQEATRWFAEAEAVTTRLGWRGPGHRWWIADQVETLLALDRVDDAVRILDAWEADARRLGRDRVLAQVTRCRGLVAAARGDVAAAASLLEDAVAQHESVGDPFGRARALLALGVVRRRRAPEARRPRRDRRGARRVRASSARRPGSRGPARSSAGSAAARARRG